MPRDNIRPRGFQLPLFALFYFSVLSLWRHELVYIRSPESSAEIPVNHGGFESPDRNHCWWFRQPFILPSRRGSRTFAELTFLLEMVNETVSVNPITGLQPVATMIANPGNTNPPEILIYKDLNQTVNSAQRLPSRRDLDLSEDDDQIFTSSASLKIKKLIFEDSVKYRRIYQRSGANNCWQYQHCNRVVKFLLGEEATFK